MPRHLTTASMLADTIMTLLLNRLWRSPTLPVLSGTAACVYSIAGR